MTADGDVLLKAFKALLHSENVAAVCTAMGMSETLGVRERKVALSALGMVGTPEAEELVVRATGSDDLEVQIAAAFQLAAPGRIRAHRDRLERLAASWPEDAGRDAGFI